MDIGGEDMVDVMIQHGGCMDGVSDWDCILLQERHRLFDILEGNQGQRPILPAWDVLKSNSYKRGLIEDNNYKIINNSSYSTFEETYNNPRMDKRFHNNDNVTGS